MKKKKIFKFFLLRIVIGQLSQGKHDLQLNLSRGPTFIKILFFTLKRKKIQISRKKFFPKEKS